MLTNVLSLWWPAVHLHLLFTNDRLRYVWEIKVPGETQILGKQIEIVQDEREAYI